MTWRQLQQTWQQGRGGIYAVVTNSIGAVTEGRLPWWVGLVLGAVGYTLPRQAVLLVKGAVKWPLKRSWLVVFAQEAATEEVARQNGADFRGAMGIGPSGERTKVVAEVMRFAEGL